jgi:hypothetical protein
MAGDPYQTNSVPELSINFLMILVFGCLSLGHLFPDAANSVLIESVEMAVGLLVCVMFSSAVIL